MDLNFLSEDTDRKAIRFDAWIIAPGSVGDFESPRMPWAGYCPLLQISPSERSTHVRAKVIDGEVLPTHVEYRYHPVLHGIGPPLTVGDIADSCDRGKFRHCKKIFGEGLVLRQRSKQGSHGRQTVGMEP